MQIYIGLVYEERGHSARLNQVRQHLTPHLKSKSRPKDFSGNPLFWAKHGQPRFGLRAIDFGPLDIHPGPSPNQGVSKRVEVLWEVIPDIPEVSGGAIIVKCPTCGFSLV